MKTHSAIRSKLFDPKNVGRLEDPFRTRWQKPEKVVGALRLKSGNTVADIGAGSGYFTFLFAQAVGPEGKVYAVDVQKEMLSHIRRKLASKLKRNPKSGTRRHLPIIPVHSSFFNLRLDRESIDLAFVASVYHETGGKRLLKEIMRVLKPSGRLAIVDWKKRNSPVGPPLEHRIRKEDVIKEARNSGFRLSKSFGFLPYQYFLVFGKQR